MRALLIEDSSVLLRLLKVTLRRPDIEFIDETIANAAANRDDLPEVEIAVIGSYMPFDAAVEIITALDRRTYRPAIVALMTDPRDEHQNTVSDAGADRIVEMPFQPDTLRSAACTSTRERGYQSRPGS